MKTQPIKQNVMARFIIKGQSTGLFPCSQGRKAGRHSLYIQVVQGMERHIAELSLAPFIGHKQPASLRAGIPAAVRAGRTCSPENTPKDFVTQKDVCTFHGK